MTPNRTAFHKISVRLACAAVLLPMSYARAQSPRPAAPSATQPAATQPANRIMSNDKVRIGLERRTPRAQFHADFAEAIDFMRDITGLKFDVQWDKLKAVGITEKTPVTVNLQNAKMHDVLTAILTSAAAKPGIIGYAIEHGAVVIGPTNPPTTQPK